MFQCAMSAQQRERESGGTCYALNVDSVCGEKRRGEHACYADRAACVVASGGLSGPRMFVCRHVRRDNLRQTFASAARMPPYASFASARRAFSVPREHALSLSPLRVR